MPPRLHIAYLLGGCLVLGACPVTIDRDQGTIPLSFKVTVAEEVGTAKNPLPYTTDARRFTLDVQAVDFQGEKADWFTGEVYLDVAPRGRLAKGQARTVMITKGRAEGVSVEIERAHGETNIWVEDRGTDDKPGSYATGLSPTLHVSHPTLHEISQTTNIAGSALADDFVRVRIDDRRLVATGIAVDGFYLTDLDEPTGTFNAIFAHTHSRPRGIEQGDRVVEIIGTVDEFYGFTELSFPTYRVDGHVDDIPVTLLSPEIVADDLRMEELESRLVEVQQVEVCPLGEGYTSFGQWVVLLTPTGNCNDGTGGITIVTALSAAEFQPADHVGDTLARITGDLRYHVAATPPWIMYTRGEDDVQVD